MATTSPATSMYSNAMEDTRPMSPLVGSLDDLWEAISLLGKRMSGVPYRPGGALNFSGDLRDSLVTDLTSERLSALFSSIKDKDSRNFADNQAYIIDKILASLPGGAGNDPRTRATVQEMAGFVGKYGPMALSMIRQQLGPEGEEGPLGALLNAADSFFEASYGSIGSQSSALSLLSGAMYGAVPLEDREARLQEYMQERYSPDNRRRLHGASAKQDASYMAMEAARNISPLNIPNRNARAIFDEALQANDINNRTLERLGNNRAEQSIRDLTRSGYMSTAISDYAKANSGGNTAVESSLRDYATQINIRNNLEENLKRSGLPFESTDLLDERNLASIQTTISKAQEEARRLYPGSDRERLLKQYRKRVDDYIKSKDAYRNAGGTLAASDIARDIEQQRTLNIQNAAVKFGDNIDADIQRAIALRNDIQRNSAEIGSISSLAENDNWKNVKNIGTELRGQLNEYFGGGANSLHNKYTTLMNNMSLVEQKRLGALLEGYQKATDKDAYWREHEQELRPLVGAAVGKRAANQDHLGAYMSLETAFAATGSTIGGKPFSSASDTAQFVNMLFQGGWGSVPASAYSQSLPNIAMGMIRAGINADQVLQYGGLAAEAAKEVGADRPTASVWGAEAATVTKVWQKENGVADEQLASYAARASGLVSKSMEGRVMNALSAHLTKEDIAKIKDPRHKAIAQKLLNKEWLSDEEIRTLRNEGTQILSDMGYSGSEIYGMLERDYSKLDAAKQNNMNLTANRMGDNQDNRDVFNDALNTSFRGKKGFAQFAQNQDILNATFNFATESIANLDYNNAGDVKANYIESLKDQGVNQAYINKVSKMKASDVVTMLRAGVEEMANKNRISVESMVNGINAGREMEGAFNKNEIITQAWNKAPQGDNNSFSKIITELRNNPGANLTDVIAAAIYSKIDNKNTDDLSRLSQAAAVAGIAGDMNLATGLDQDARTKTYDVMSKLVKEVGYDKATTILETAGAEGWEALTDEQREAVRKANITGGDINAAGKNFMKVSTDIEDKIKKQMTSQDPDIKAKVEDLEKADRNSPDGEAKGKGGGGGDSALAECVEGGALKVRVVADTTEDKKSAAPPAAPAEP